MFVVPVEGNYLMQGGSVPIRWLRCLDPGWCRWCFPLIAILVMYIAGVAAGLGPWDGWLLERASAYWHLAKTTGFPTPDHPFSSLALPGEYCPPGVLTELVLGWLQGVPGHPIIIRALRCLLFPIILLTVRRACMGSVSPIPLPWLAVLVLAFSWGAEIVPVTLVLLLSQYLLSLTGGNLARWAGIVLLVASPLLDRYWPISVLFCLSQWIRNGRLHKMPGRLMVVAVIGLGGVGTLLSTCYRSIVWHLPWECRPDLVFTGVAWEAGLQPWLGWERAIAGGGWVAIFHLGAVSLFLIVALGGAFLSSHVVAHLLVWLFAILWGFLAPPAAPWILFAAWLITLSPGTFQNVAQPQAPRAFGWLWWGSLAGWCLLLLVIGERCWFQLTRLGTTETQILASVENPAWRLAAAMANSTEIPPDDWLVIDPNLGPAWCMEGLGPIEAIGPDLEWYGENRLIWESRLRSLAGSEHPTAQALAVSHPDAATRLALLKNAVQAPAGSAGSAAGGMRLLGMAGNIPLVEAPARDKARVGRAPRLDLFIPLNHKTGLHALELEGWLNWYLAHQIANGARYDRRCVATQSAALVALPVGDLLTGWGGTSFLPAISLARGFETEPAWLVAAEPGDGAAALVMAARAGWSALADPDAKGAKADLLFRLGTASRLLGMTRLYSRHSEGLRLISTVRHAQSTRCLRLSANLGNREAAAELARQFLQLGFLDAALHFLDKTTASDSQDSWTGGKAMVPADLELLRQVREQVAERGAVHALQTRQLVDNPVAQAQSALDAGLGETALSHLENCPETLLTPAGARMELELLALLGRTDTLLELVDGTRAADLDGYLGPINLETGSGVMMIPGGAWFSILAKAAHGRVHEAAQTLEDLAQRFDDEKRRNFRLMRSLGPRQLGLWLGVPMTGTCQLGALAGAIDQEELAGMVADTEKLERFSQDLRGLEFHLLLQESNPARARTQLDGLLDQSRLHSCSHLGLWLRECTLLGSSQSFR